MPLQRALYACSVTATTTPQSLLALMQAKGGNYATVQGSCQMWSVQVDETSTVDVFLGDENVSSTNCGFHFNATGNPAAAPFIVNANPPGMGAIGALYVRSASGTAQLNVMVFPQ